MNEVELTINIQDFGQTNGETYHARFNCEKKAGKGAKQPDLDTKLAETLLLLPAIIRLIQREAEDESDT